MWKLTCTFLLISSQACPAHSPYTDSGAAVPWGTIWQSRAPSRQEKRLVRCHYFRVRDPGCHSLSSLCFFFCDYFQQRIGHAFPTRRKQRHNAFLEGGVEQMS